MTSHQEIRPALTREELEAHWMPYTGNRQFKDDPRMIVAAEGVHLIDDRGRRILVTTAGKSPKLCTNRCKPSTTPRRSSSAIRGLSNWPTGSYR